MTMIDDFSKDLESPVQKTVYHCVVEFLRINANGKANRKLVDDIVIGVVNAFPDSFPNTTNEKQNKTQIYRIMLDASKSPFSPVTSTGKGGTGAGYYYSETKTDDGKDAYTAEVNGLSDSSGAGQSGTNAQPPDKILEKNLWPLVAKWFEVVKNYKLASSHIANNNRGGQWGNPDVVALNPIDKCGLWDVEIATAEVKLSDTNWRQYFFEAVSHKRLSERSYFVFASFDEDYDLEDDFYTYSEKFGVGVVVIELNKEQRQALARWDDLEISEQLQMIDQVDEKIPAARTPISVREKVNFLKQIGVEDRQDLYDWIK